MKGAGKCKIINVESLTRTKADRNTDTIKHQILFILLTLCITNWGKKATF